MLLDRDAWCRSVNSGVYDAIRMARSSLPVSGRVGEGSRLQFDLLDFEHSAVDVQNGQCDWQGDTARANAAGVEIEHAVARLDFGSV